jgi:hypothetical protein
MPFDSATEPKLRAKQAHARQAADALDFVIRKYESGEWPWVSGSCNSSEPEKGICAGYALSLAAQIFGHRESPAHDYAVRIITERRYWATVRARSIPCLTSASPPTNQHLVIWYNDTRRRTYPQILSVLRKARDLAMKEAFDAI